MTYIVKFLTARFDEAESAILEHWDSDGRAQVAVMWTGPEPGYVTAAIGHSDNKWFADGHEVTDASHVRVMFDSKSALADIAAKRKILELHAGLLKPQPGINMSNVVIAMGGVLRCLAEPFRDHPDYNPLWSWDEGPCR